MNLVIIIFKVMNLIRQYMKVVLVLLISFLGMQCNLFRKEKKKLIADENRYSYSVIKAEYPPEINSVWEKEIWQETKDIRLANYMGDKPLHFPETNVKLRYDKNNVYIIFRVLDNYVKAVEKKINGKVWFDSCVEFFFSPGPDTERGYFNFEVNCKGVFLLKFNTGNGNNNGFVEMEDCKKINISHSLEREVENEIVEPLEWRVEYSIPYSMLKKYMKVESPAPGVKWRANFYKCADKSSHPHWLTWAQVDYPRPKFHLPEFFGQLNFE